MSDEMIGDATNPLRLSRTPHVCHSPVGWMLRRFDQGSDASRRANGIGVQHLTGPGAWTKPKTLQVHMCWNTANPRHDIYQTLLCYMMLHVYIMCIHVPLQETGHPQDAEISSWILLTTFSLHLQDCCRFSATCSSGGRKIQRMPASPGAVTHHLQVQGEHLTNLPFNSLRHVCVLPPTKVPLKALPAFDAQGPWCRSTCSWDQNHIASPAPHRACHAAPTRGPTHYWTPRCRSSGQPVASRPHRAAQSGGQIIWKQH